MDSATVAVGLSPQLIDLSPTSCSDSPQPIGDWSMVLGVPAKSLPVVPQPCGVFRKSFALPPMRFPERPHRLDIRPRSFDVAPGPFGLAP